MDLAERIRWALNRRGGSARAWSLAAGRSHAQVTMMLRRLDAGEEPDFGSAVFEDLARAAGVSASWLASGRGSPTEDVDDGDADPRRAARAMFLAHEHHEGRGDQAKAFLAERGEALYAGAEGRGPEWWLAQIRDEYRLWRRPDRAVGVVEISDGEEPRKPKAARRKA